MNAPTTPDGLKHKLKAAIGLLHAMSEAVRGAGPGGMPSGLLYTVVMPHVEDLQAYERAVDTLVAAGVVRRGQNHLLHWNVTMVVQPNEQDAEGTPIF